MREDSGETYAALQPVMNYDVVSHCSTCAYRKFKRPFARGAMVSPGRKSGNRVVSVCAASRADRLCCALSAPGERGARRPVSHAVRGRFCLESQAAGKSSGRRAGARGGARRPRQGGAGARAANLMIEIGRLGARNLAGAVDSLRVAGSDLVVSDLPVVSIRQIIGFAPETLQQRDANDPGNARF